MDGSNGSKRADILVSNLLTGSLALSAVILRFVSKKLAGARLWYDDAFIVVAFIFAFAFLVIEIYATFHFGLGMHISDPARQAQAAYDLLRGIFIAQIFYRISLVFSKYSLLALFWRLFSKRRKVRLAIYVVGSVTTIWGISTIITQILQCSPIHRYWDRPGADACHINPYTFLVTSSVTNSVTDVALIAIPLPVIWRLNSTYSQKIALTATFTLGLFVCVISAIRIGVIHPDDLLPTEINWSYTPVGIWSLVEANFAIVCACLSSLRPVLIFFTTGSLGCMCRAQRRKRRMERLSSDHGATMELRKHDGNQSEYEPYDFKKIPDIYDLNTVSGDLGLGVVTTIGAGARSRGTIYLEDGITVKREVVVD